MVGLEHDADKRVSDYSKGMKSRLNFIKALLHDPLLLCLDEPTSGLDPTNSRMMNDIILAEKAKGKTILLTTHNMQDATELCDRVAFIINGKICALDRLSTDEQLKGLIAKNRLQSIHSSEPTLNDIFMDITGRTLL